jgi:tetratricopeptide (TPR) repeat protein
MHQMRSITSLLCVFLFAISVAGCVKRLPPLSDAEWMQICTRAKDPRHRVTGCTQLIDSGKLAPDELATALTLRAEAYLDFYRVVPQQYGRALNQAIADADQALRLDPNRVWAYIHRCTAYKRSKRLDLAIADCTQALRLAPPDSKDPSARFAAGVAFGHRGAAKSMKDDFRGAIPDHLESIRLVPNYFIGGGYNWLCWDRAAAGDLDQALADCNQALRITPDDPDIIADRGFVYLKLGRYAEAIADYDAALATNPRLYGALYGRGRAKQLAGLDADSAAADIAAARRLNPKVVERFAIRGLPPPP